MKMKKKIAHSRVKKPNDKVYDLVPKDISFKFKPWDEIFNEVIAQFLEKTELDSRNNAYYDGLAEAKYEVETAQAETEYAESLHTISNLTLEHKATVNYNYGLKAIINNIISGDLLEVQDEKKCK